MDFPSSVTLKSIQKTYKGYSENVTLWDKIDDLIKGGNRIHSKKEKYLPMIPGEDQGIYNKRLEKFTYENVMGGSISELTRKLSTGTINVLGLPESDQNIFYDFWIDFRKDITKTGCNENKYVEKIFQYFVNYGLIYCMIDQEGESTGNIVTDIKNGLTPYVSIYHPSIIVDKGYNNGEKWYKLRFIENYETPFDDLTDLYSISWLIVSDTSVAEYKGIYQLSSKGEIIAIYENGSLIPVTIDSSVTLADPGIIYHGQPDNPLIEYTIDEQYWISNNAHLRQLEHLRELNAKHDINTMLYIQRTFKPRVEKDDSLEYISEEVESSIKSGNPYILDVEEFKFNEPSGSSSKTLLENLEATSADIRKLYGLGPKETSKGALERSGASKEMDFITIRDILENIGLDIVNLLNTIYNRIAFIIGYNNEVMVTGLDNFQVNLLSNDIDNALQVQNVETSISPTALTLFYQRISHELAPSATPEQKQMIDKEVENIFAASISLSRGENLDQNDNER